MTLPTRPAPAPPGSRAQNAAANANASLEQLRLQLQQQQQLQRQNVTVPKLTIKLPPPPKVPQTTSNSTLYNGFANNNNSVGIAEGQQSSITRKFPQARYAPATNWDDSPFDVLSGGSNLTATANANGNYKKQPPPRPPPPKVQPKKTTVPAAPAANILSNIFHRKKTSRAPTPNSASRVYGAATYGTTTTIMSSSTTSTSTSQLNTFSQTSWNNAWNTTPNSVAAQHTQSSSSSITAEGQLISFDSPPSSPTFTQKSNSDCLSVDSFSSDSNFSSPNNGSVSQPESGFEDDFSANARSSRPATTSPIDPWETLETFGHVDTASQQVAPRYGIIGTAPVRNLNVLNTRVHANGAAASGDNPLCNGKSLLPPAPTLNMPTIIKPKISQKPKAPKPPSLVKPNGTTIYNDNMITPPSPPMPQCAPPPPPPLTTLSSLEGRRSGVPSLLDVISGKVDALHLYSGEGAGGDALEKQPYGIALYDFNSTEDGDLCFRENEKIYLIEQVSADWYRGRSRSGCEGIFPINYVEIKVPLSYSTTSANPQKIPAAESLYSSSTTTTYQNNTSYTRNTMQVKSLYNFPAEVQGDLELKENDLVTILYRVNEDWLYGEANGRQGQFPANFLEYVPSNIPMP